MNQVTTEFLENGSGLMQQRSTKGKIPQDLGEKKLFMSIIITKVLTTVYEISYNLTVRYVGFIFVWGSWDEHIHQCFRESALSCELLLPDCMIFINKKFEGYL